MNLNLKDLAYKPTVWKDRLVQYPNRYQDDDGNYINLTQAPGEVAEEGTPIIEEYMNNIENGINRLSNNLLNLIYPIGSIIQNMDLDFNPNICFGGTWERIKGKVLVGVDEDDEDFATVGMTGGEKKHQLSIDELPKHNFKINVDGYCTNVSGGTGYTVPNANTVGVKANMYTEKLGEDVAHNNLQPYETVYIWKRVA